MKLSYNQGVISSNIPPQDGRRDNSSILSSSCRNLDRGRAFVRASASYEETCATRKAPL